MRRTIAFLLILLLTVSVLPVTPFAAAYSDVPPDAWFAEDVAVLSEAGILHGYPDGSFLPYGSVTRAEYLTMLLAALGVLPETSGREEHWAASRVRAAANVGILEEAFRNMEAFRPDEPVTRTDAAVWLVRGLRLEETRRENPFTDCSDPSAVTAYHEYLIRGYETGSGVEFRGGQGATRAEAAAMIRRVLTYTADPAAYRSAQITQYAEDHQLNADAEIIDTIMNAVRMRESGVSVPTSRPQKEVEKLLKMLEGQHSELFMYDGFGFYFTQESPLIMIRFMFERPAEEVYAKADLAAVKAEQTAASLVTDGMTDAEKVRVLHNWLLANCRYDPGHTIAADSYTAYGALVSGVAVCQGYAAAMNLLCRAAGVRCISVPGKFQDGDHSWNAVLIGDEVRYIDATYNDTAPEGNAAVALLVTDAQLSALGHAWNRADITARSFYY